MDLFNVKWADIREQEALIHEGLKTNDPILQIINL